MRKQSPTNHGEGDPKAANRFNVAEQHFVGSAAGKKRIHDGAQVQPGEAADLAKAEQLGKERSKGDDPAPRRPPKQ